MTRVSGTIRGVTEAARFLKLVLEKEGCILLHRIVTMDGLPSHCYLSYYPGGGLHKSINVEQPTVEWRHMSLG